MPSFRLNRFVFSIPRTASNRVSKDAVFVKFGRRGDCGKERGKKKRTFILLLHYVIQTINIGKCLQRTFFSSINLADIWDYS
jgi:hypothetical protein